MIYINGVLLPFGNIALATAVEERHTAEVKAKWYT
jgi:hypothetical protein